ncbi:MAG: TrgA family protein [bacterium]
MPTAAKLVAAVAFALVGWLTARAYIPQLPEGTNTGFFPEITAALGFAIGWLTLGPNVGRGYVEALSYGLRTSIFLVFWALLGFSIYYMVLRSTKMIYHNAGEAVLDVPLLMLQYGKLLAASEVIMTLVIGGILGGWVAEFARRWR